MIRRHLTPALVVFTFLLAICVFRPVLAGRLQPLLSLAVLFAAVAVAFLGAGGVRDSLPDTARRVGALAACASLGLILGMVSAARMSEASLRAFLPVPEADVSGFSGVVTQDSSLSREGETVLRIALRDDASARRGITAEARGNALVIVPGDYRFSLGQRLSVHAALALFDSAGPEAYIARAERRDMRTAGYTGIVWAFRAEAREWMHRSVSGIGYPGSALLEALLIGSRQDVPESLYDAFLRTGSLHILALSGLHVTVLYGIVAGLLGLLRSRWGRFLIATIVLLFYQFLAGFMPSLLRATVMIVVGGTALLLDRDGEPLNILAISGIVLLLIDPFQIYSLSFQLSFLALAGILALGPLVQRPLEAWLPKPVLLPLAMSVGAQMATLPLVVAQFGVYYPSGLAASLILVPLTTGYLWAGLAWLPLSVIPWPFLHDACARGFALLYRIIEGSARLLARLPGVSFHPAVAPWISSGALALLLCMALLLPLRRGAAQPQPRPALAKHA
jgi:competence protein ComEC